MTNIVIPIEQQRRELEKEQERQKQNKEWNERRINSSQREFNRSTSAETDKYMRDALSKVWESDVGMPVALTRFHGSYLYNKQAPPKTDK